jgi:hypothetical protein
MGRLVMTALALVVTLVAPLANAQASERTVSVTLTSDEVVQGRFGGSTDQAFTIVVARQNVTVQWAQIKAITFGGAAAASLGAASQPPVTSTLVSPASSSATKTTQPVSGRCQATTKKGTQCSRNAKAGSNFCWQHGG